MINTQYINLNMIPSGVMPVLYCSQYDVGRPLGVVVYNGAESVDLSGYTCTIEATRTDKTPVTAGVTTSGNIGVFETTATMTNQADTYKGKLVLTDGNGKRVASLAFVLVVAVRTMDEDAEEIEEDASLYQQYTETVQTIIAQIRSDLVAEANARQAAVNAEASARQAADQTLQQNINAEASARQSADNTLQSNINVEASARATQDNVLQAEIDQLIAPSGSAPSAAEVTNARIGADGTTYDTLGNAIRGQVTDVKSALQDTTENLLIDGWVDGKFISTNEATYNPSSAVYNASFRYVFVNCAEGDVFTINGTGGGNPRLWAFADSANNILDRSAANATGSNLVITAPANAVRLILNDKAKTANSYGGILLKDTVKDVSEKADKNANDIVTINTRMVNADGDMYINPDDFELGNITFSAIGMNYNSSQRRVRTKQNYELVLDVGDVIRVKDSTKAKVNVCFQTYAGTYGITDFVSEYTAEYGGNYYLVLEAVPAEVQTSKDALLSQLEIIRYKNNKQNNKITAALINNPLLAINHRGFNRTAPENTIPAFKLSKGYGFTHIETDIVWTSDGVAVCLHDNTINRTARNADGTEISSTVNIADITYEQALTYDFGIWKAARYAGTRIPTFEEVLTLCKKQGIKVCAEVKSYGYTNARMTAVMDSVKGLGAESYVVWISFEDTILNYIKGVDPTATLELISASVTSETISKVQALKTTSNKVLIASKDYSSAALALCEAAGIPLTVYTVNSKQTMNALPGYVSGATSDLYPINVVWNESVT